MRLLLAFWMRVRAHENIMYAMYTDDGVKKKNEKKTMQ